MQIKRGRIYQVGDRCYQILNDDSEIVQMKDLATGIIVKRYRGQLKPELIRNARNNEK